MHALIGIPSYKTMIVGGIIDHKKVKILMDSSSTHNFLNESWVIMNGLKMETLASLRVSIAGGQLIPIEGLIKKLDWKIHDMSFPDDILL